ncbi:Hsp20/alpha crystallin family protein [Actinokineospora globicatena]|uniref:Hsp20/alpha crystallin family protein n=1 Tax=Actinokineospora globicatena TaxID=103729 RepID=UPI0020A25FF0|nr:Hsp20/alpha crystallin family protein [Actinokineospora globicatena]MCP2306125.1 Molecular chaperone IbpA, HSP20 family [Actinokineospora globicatena]GLW80000.1 hypothetical protein Aglo01_44810 [Actinokineospora globicatena]GLW86829.1 hypothetical protein Aglo02_44680 [Actinokineospora globicatena]
MTSILPRSAFVPDLARLFEAFPFYDRHLLRVEDHIADGVYVLRAEVPGVDPEEGVKVTVQGDVLTVATERSEAKHQRGRSEFHYGLAARSVTLPRGADVDAIKATCRDGVLELRVPLRESPEGKQIPVTATGH